MESQKERNSFTGSLGFVLAAACFYIVYLGVEKGIEKYSKILMPALAVIVLFIAVYSLFLKFTDADGITRTGLQGVGIYLIPNFDGLTLKRFLQICLDAIGQLFYSLSIAMGNMITFGSYMKKDVKLEKSVNQIIAFDTGIAFLAGLIIIPTVYVFSGAEGLQTVGASLIFVALPKIFATLGVFGQILGVLDYASNNILMPLIGILTCILIGWVCKPKTAIDEITFNGEKFGRKSLYVVMIKYVAPILLFIILLTGLGII